MSERPDALLLDDIREAIRRIRTYVGEMAWEEFRNDLKTQDSVVRNLEIIGEASRKLSESARSASTEIPWRSMAGMRDRLIHHYAGVNLDIVWQVVSVELDELSRALDRLPPA